MKLEILDDDYYKVYINSFYIDDFDINNNNELGKYIKQIIIKIRKIYDIILEGFYEVHVYVLKNLGIILEIKNIDRYVSKTIDLKIILHKDEEIYLELPDYEFVYNCKDLKYLNNNFYFNIDNLKDKDVFVVFEHYKIVYGEVLKQLKRNWVSLTK